MQFKNGPWVKRHRLLISQFESLPQHFAGNVDLVAQRLKDFFVMVRGATRSM
jgi:hypothetical protein